MRPTIARDIAAIALVYDLSGRTTQPIRVRSSASTIEKAIRNCTPGFFRVKNDGGGNRFFTKTTPLSC